mmetsp:Transcript_88930/g.140509  ORF Transcript_88930/g.140509 Transcript_88930/m.140509 type:complete len:116 (-) Transcript_88930:215-562(-)
MREAADFLPSTIAVVAELGLVLRSVVRDLLARVRERAVITSETLLALLNSIAPDVPVTQLPRNSIDQGPPSLRFEVEAEARRWGHLRSLVPGAIATHKLRAHHCMVMEDVLAMVG